MPDDDWALGSNTVEFRNEERRAGSSRHHNPEAFTDDVLRRLVKANREYLSEHPHYIVALAHRLLVARQEIERLRDVRGRGVDEAETA